MPPVDRSSGFFGTRDELLMSLLSSEAVVDSRGYEVLSAEEVEELKKVCLFDYFIFQFEGGVAHYTVIITVALRITTFSYDLYTSALRPTNAASTIPHIPLFMP